MKMNVLSLLILPLLFAAPASAGEWDLTPYTPYDVDIIYREEAADYIRYVEDTWVLYQVGKRSMTRIERLATAEYHTKNLHLKIRLDLNDLKPVIKSKIEYKGKVVYLEFAYTD